MKNTTSTLSFTSKRSSSMSVSNPPVPAQEKNVPFKVIRNFLVNKHQESLARPDFKNAEIAPIEIFNKENVKK